MQLFHNLKHTSIVFCTKAKKQIQQMQEETGIIFQKRFDTFFIKHAMPFMATRL